jgi:hypothetical protein
MLQKEVIRQQTLYEKEKKRSKADANNMLLQKETVRQRILYENEKKKGSKTDANKVEREVGDLRRIYTEALYQYNGSL